MGTASALIWTDQRRESAGASAPAFFGPPSLMPVIFRRARQSAGAGAWDGLKPCKARRFMPINTCQTMILVWPLQQNRES